MDSPQQTLQAIQRRLHDKFSPSALAEYEAEKQERVQQLALESIPIGFPVKDPVLAQCVRILRLLHIAELRELQTLVNESIVSVQQYTFNTRVDAKLGEPSNKSMDRVPITERPNVITQAIDEASTLQIVSLLQQSDDQMFSGFETFPAMVDQEVCATITAVANAAQKLLCDTDNNVIVLGGSGTSGRFAFLTARAMNQALVQTGRAPCFRYLCAGGDAALFQSKEAPEDNWRLGIEELKQKLEGKTSAMYVGITCGLSAPVVAGQLKYCLDNIDRIVPVLLGFNSLSLARDVAIEGWNLTCKDVLTELDSAARSYAIGASSRPAFIINPVVGPESVTGSTRMKGGSATKFILEAMFSCALQPSPAPCTPELLEEYSTGLEEAYRAKAQIAQTVEVAGQVLKAGGRIVYLGQGTFGITGLIDASECPPTYNARHDDVRAFLDGGFATLQNVDGDLEMRGPEYLLSWDSFEHAILPSLTSADVVFFLSNTTAIPPKVQTLAHQLRDHSVRTGLVSVLPRGAVPQTSDILWHSQVHIELSRMTTSVAPADTLFVAESALKIVLNAITTGGHIIKGKVMRNRMIDLQVSNNKLFFRSIGIVADFASVSDHRARESLIRSIYGVDVLASEHIDAEISCHIKTAVDVARAGRRVVPIAILLAATAMSFAEASQRLSVQPVVSRAIREVRA